MHENFLKRGVQKISSRVQKNRLRVQKYQNRMFMPSVKYDIDTTYQYRFFTKNDTF